MESWMNVGRWQDLYLTVLINNKIKVEMFVKEEVFSGWKL